MVHVLKMNSGCSHDKVYGIAKEIVKENPGDSVVVIPENVEFFLELPSGAVDRV